MPGSATVFVIGGFFITAFQVGRVSPGLASCMRHYGDGSISGPTACKVTQQLQLSETTSPSLNHHAVPNIRTGRERN